MTFKCSTTLLLLGASVFSGCASITTGNRQSVAVQTTADAHPVVDAECMASNDKGSWPVTSPGTVDVALSFQDLSVKCESVAYEAGVATFKSTTKAMAFGNVIFGGVIGAAIDVSSGAAFEYPSTLVVALGKPTGKAAPVVMVQPVSASMPVLQRGDVLEYSITDRYTGNKHIAKLHVDSSNEREITFNGGSRVEQKASQTAKSTSPSLGDMDLFEPPMGWGRRNMTVGASWRDTYEVNDGGYGSQVQIEGRLVRNEVVKMGKHAIDAAYIEYSGSAVRTAGALRLSHRSVFKTWVEKSTGRVLRFESDINSSSGSQTARNSRETMELVRVLRDGNPM